ncbi:hypothetical protein LIS04_199 [Listeria phage LIS04]|nr:hypothetical protein LIS04_199 [Listeria phage LIS04]
MKELGIINFRENNSDLSLTHYQDIDSKNVYLTLKKIVIRIDHDINARIALSSIVNLFMEGKSSSLLRESQVLTYDLLTSKVMIIDNPDSGSIVLSILKGYDIESIEVSKSDLLFFLIASLSMHWKKFDGFARDMSSEVSERRLHLTDYFCEFEVHHSEDRPSVYLISPTSRDDGTSSNLTARVEVSHPKLPLHCRIQKLDELDDYVVDFQIKDPSTVSLSNEVVKFLSSRRFEISRKLMLELMSTE